MKMPRIKNRSLVNQKNSKLEYSWLDCARAIAILSVVAVHSSHATNEYLGDLDISLNPQVFLILDLGKYGVELFFFISGILLTHLYSDQKIGSKYWLRRFLRIWPLWLIFSLVSIFEFMFTGKGPWAQTIQGTNLPQPIILFLSLSFLGWTSAAIWNTAVPGGWSIQAEVAHYLFFPLIRNASLTRIYLTLFCFSAISAVMRFVSQVDSSMLSVQVIKSLNRLGFFNTVIFFILGILACRIFKERNSKFKIIATKQMSNSHLTAVAFLVFFPMLNFSIPAIGFLAYALILSYFISAGPLKKVFSWIGKRSYFIYFVHFIVLRYLIKVLAFPEVSDRLSPGLFSVSVFLGIFIITIIISLFISEISYRWLEKPIYKMSHRNS